MGLLSEIVNWIFGSGTNSIDRDKIKRQSQVVNQRVTVPRQAKAIPEKKNSVIKEIELPKIQKRVLPPLKNIDPNAFGNWAGGNLDRWQMLIGASINHDEYGRGTIEKVYRAKYPDLSRILLSICLEKEPLKTTFYSFEFNHPKGTFNKLFVNVDCFAEFEKGIKDVSIVEQVDAREIPPTVEKQPEQRIIFTPRIDSSKCKSNWQEFSQILADYQIDALYHFTDNSNIASIIRNGGLYSWWYCDENGISILKPGGNELSRDLDCRKGLQDYVRLSFNSQHPMLSMALHQGRIEQPFMLEISPEVILWNSTLFSNQNAASSTAEIGDNLEAFKKIKFDIAIKPYYNGETEKTFYQAEVLVQTHIPIEFILNIPTI